MLMIAYLGRRGRGKSKDLQRESSSHIEYVRTAEDGVSPAHQAARRQRPAVDRHEENQLELKRLVRVCFGARHGLKFDIAPSPKTFTIAEVNPIRLR